MGIITAVFYPLFAKIHGWINTLSKKIIKSGKSVAGKFLGMLLAFLVCFGILFYLYLRMWYGISL
jgi:phosphotransferase system  glucose/maltose/N-acetylglucosamine-specific IIC component